MNRLRKLTGIAILVAVIGCGSSAPGDAEGTDTMGEVSGVGSMLVRYGDAASPVDLATQSSLVIQGQTMVRLSDVVAASHLSVDLSAVVAGFRGADGFDPATKPTCIDVFPMSGERLQQGYVILATRNLWWDEELGYPGCIHVSDCAEIILSNP